MDNALKKHKVESPSIPLTEHLFELNEIQRATPFLKWVGGKRGVIQLLKSRLPIKYGDYYEGFVGGGALYFALHPSKAFLSDTNPDLILTYQVIQQQPKKLISKLKKHEKSHNKEYYYKIRKQHRLKNPLEIAARMIYLNKTCFNGLWRVNSKGEFNVPMGSYINPAICNQENIMACHHVLQNAIIERKDFHSITPEAGDFVYFDPPYHRTSETSFTAYAKSDFSEQDQIALAEFSKSLHKKGVYVMISNSNTKFIRSLYKEPSFKTQIIMAPRTVNSNAKGRKPVEEVLITNF